MEAPTKIAERCDPVSEPSAPKCECDNTGLLDPAYAGWYDPELELPFVNHAPGECQCTNDLALYNSNGATRWLCSCCCTFGDIRISEGQSNG